MFKVNNIVTNFIMNAFEINNEDTWKVLIDLDLGVFTDKFRNIQNVDLLPV